MMSRAFTYPPHLTKSNPLKIESYLNLSSLFLCMAPETVTISESEYRDLKKHKEVDEELLHELVQGLKDVIAGNVKRVR